MKNLAGNENCDDTIKKELEEAGVPFYEHKSARNAEVPSKISALLPGWTLTRAWYYWVAEADDGCGLPFHVANTLHESHGKECRVAGHCGCPSPEWYSKYPWLLGVPLYHIDTQEALNAFVSIVWGMAGDSVDVWKENNSVLSNL